ncbi:hemerythrin domain-containing protein [Rhizobium sp. L1K21]|uniref:hemerythrin domain-containing protein n=1 Tax=Rhizobium sp. L1K21 TaxID=2954933 RepID=UPI0020931326|nr:hemerythrin domain-containing protein [Rhizobium sp. L1K21]MCO6186190.1 hemerythrin domain-containing protein [Rhizobium sp. L1K21]
MPHTSAVMTSGESKAPVTMDASKLRWLTQGHIEQLSLCDTLEKIADSLPDDVDKAQCLAVEKSLPSLIKRIHEFEENTLFPWLEAQLPDREDLRETLNRLKFEHVEDECFAEELLDLLHKMAVGGKPANAEAAGYMLRGFFESVRRHIAFEREHLMGLVTRLSGDYDA